jgi:hypothetical protein
MRMLRLPRFLQFTLPAALSFGVILPLALAPAAQAQTEMEAFHWIDFHDQKDAPTVAWVTQEMKSEKWSAIREIGVQWDSALVITTLRGSPQAAPGSDVETAWSISLSRHEVQPLFHGVKLRVVDWTSFAGAMTPELGIAYEDCIDCQASTFFTTVHYSFPDHGWRARWMRGNLGAELVSGAAVEGMVRTQIDGLLSTPDGRQTLATWSHFDYNGAKPAEDYVFTYSVDPSSGLEQTQGLSAKHAGEVMAQICRASTTGEGGAAVDALHAALTRGQDSALCAPYAKPNARSLRRPVTTPPANNRGQSEPPGGRMRRAPVTAPVPATPGPQPQAKPAPKP